MQSTQLHLILAHNSACGNMGCRCPIHPRPSWIMKQVGETNAKEYNKNQYNRREVQCKHLGSKSVFRAKILYHEKGMSIEHELYSKIEHKRGVKFIQVITAR